MREDACDSGLQLLRLCIRRVHDGAVFGVLTLAGLVVAVAAPPLLVPRLVAGRERLVARVLVAGALAAIAIGLVAVSVVSGNPFTKAERGFSRGECSNTADRLICTNNNSRSGASHVARASSAVHRIGQASRRAASWSNTRCGIENVPVNAPPLNVES